MPYSILHIADPHFGHSHFTHHGDPKKEGQEQAAELMSQLERYPSLPQRFDALILSGDFTFGCKEEGFQAAVAFIDAIAHLVRKDGILVIPGNHDIDLGRPVMIDKLSLPTPKEKAEAPFRKQFLQHLEKYTGPPNDRLSMVTRIDRPGEKGVVIVGLNSCRVERRDAQGFGYVGIDQISEAGRLLLAPAYGGPGAQPGDLVLAVIHHNPLPIWDIGLEALGMVPQQRKFSFLMDAAAVLNALSDIGIGVLLHGHTHVKSVKRVTGYGSGQNRPDYSTLVLGAGSLGVLNRRKDAPHHFQIIEINGNDLQDNDLTAFSRLQNTRREWYPTLRREPHRIFTFWDPEKAQAALDRLEQSAQTAAEDYYIGQSWAQLRARQDEVWNEVLQKIFLKVCDLNPAASLAGVAQAIETLLVEPPPENMICEVRLEQYIDSRLRSQ